MKIGLVDVDSHNYPNLVLMKLSSYHKSIGDKVEFFKPFSSYDRIYCSKVFSFTKDFKFPTLQDFSNVDIQIGGTGYGDYSKVLPDEIEHTCPDYSLYGIKDIAYGFTTRGCIRHCSFCLVHAKEGSLRPHADIEEFLDGRNKLILMDNNIVACDHGIKQLEKCKSMNISVDCNQGLDARILYKSNYLLNLIANLKTFTRIKIACDQDNEIEPCCKVVDRILTLNPKKQFEVFCILTEDKENSLKRVNIWKKYGNSVSVYAPPFRDYTDSKQVIPKWQKDLSRWANSKILYYSCEFKDYQKSMI